MTRDEARQILRSLLAERGITVAPESGDAELARLALLADPLPEALTNALSETFDAAAAGAIQNNIAE